MFKLQPKFSFNQYGIALLCLVIAGINYSFHRPSYWKNNNPVIDELTPSAKKIYLPKQGNYSILDFQYKYFDDNGDIDLMRFISINPEGNQDTVELKPVSMLGINGTSGTASHSFTFKNDDIVGKYQFLFQLVDKEGNYSNIESTHAALRKYNCLAKIFNKNRVPVIREVSPTIVSSGEIIKIKGRAFSSKSYGVNAVTLNHIPLAIESATNNLIKVKIPEYATNGRVVLKTNRGDITSKKELKISSSIRIKNSFKTILRPKEKVQLAAVYSGLQKSDILWKVNGTVGGNAKMGFVDEEGTYIAPIYPPPEGKVNISAVSKKDTSVSHYIEVQLIPSRVVKNDGVIDNELGGIIEDAQGFISLIIPPKSLEKDLKIDSFICNLSFSNEEIKKFEKGFYPFAGFRLRLGNEGFNNLSKVANFQIKLPHQFQNGAVFQIQVKDGSKYTALGEVKYEENNQYTLNIPLSYFGGVTSNFIDVVIVGKPELPPIYPPVVKKLKTPPNISKIEEGLTLPVLIEGTNFKWVSGVYVEGIHSNHLVLGPHIISADGKKLGFTVKILPMPFLQGGELLPITFRIQSLTDFTLTNPDEFIISGLPELIVAPNPNSNIYTIDGIRVDQITNGSKKYSTLIVEENAVLGIGSTVTSVSADGQSWSLGNIDEIERYLGRLEWNYNNNRRILNNIRLFQPENDHTLIDVTGLVSVEGTIYMAGMHGGENPSLKQVSIINGRPVGPGRARLGGISSNTLSGGMGGDGGVSVGNQTRDGNNAGNIPRNQGGSLGKGRGASGTISSSHINASGGSRFDEIEISLTQFFENLVAIGSAIGSTAGANPSTTFETIKTMASYGKDVLSISSNISSYPSTNNGIQHNQIVAGQGGNGGLRPSGVSSRLIDDDREIIPGGGGGGGGGGGSSSYTETVFGIFQDTDNRVGGGGAGGGGAAGALRITAASSFSIEDGAIVEANGGRGGYGEPHRYLGSPGGGGGGGTGGVVKFQAPFLDIQGDIDLSGGERGGALAGFNGFRAPYNFGRIALLPSRKKGGIIFYGYDRWGSGNWSSPNNIKLLWPTGRLRANLSFSFLNGIKAIREGDYSPEIPDESALENPLARAIAELSKGLLVISEDNKVYFTTTTSINYYSSNLDFLYPSEIIDIDNIPQISRFFQPSCIAKSPKAPYHIFIGGTIGDATNAYSQIHEFEPDGNYVRKVFEKRTFAHYGGVGHLKEIDFLSNGDLIGLMFTFPQQESGIHKINTSNGNSNLILHLPGNEINSMSVYRDSPENDLIYLTWSTTHLTGLPLPSPKIKIYKKNGLNWEETHQSSLIYETVGSPGEPGLIRVDGNASNSKKPIMRFDGFELDEFKFPIGSNTPSLSKFPVLSSFSQFTGNYPSFESLVFDFGQIQLQILGGKPNGEIFLRKNFEGQTLPPAVMILDRNGRLFTSTNILPGFNELWVETNESGGAHEYLRKTVLYIE